MSPTVFCVDKPVRGKGTDLNSIRTCARSLIPEKTVIDTWRNTPPPTLCGIPLIVLLGERSSFAHVKCSCIRNAVERFEEAVDCDELRVTMLETYGCPQFKMFEIRVY